MSKQLKMIVVMNLMFNLFLAVILSAAAQLQSTGGIMFPAILVDILIAYIMEMVIALGLPFSKWGQDLANRYAQPGTLKYRCLMTTGTAVPFSIVMCAGMSFISIVLMQHLPLGAWVGGVLKMFPLFLVLAWILSYFFVPVFMGLAHRIVFGNEQE